MNPLDVVQLTPLMELSSGRPEITIGLLDGPVAMDHPDLAHARIQALTTSAPAACTQADSAACRHGTFVAGMLCGQRHSPAPAICPGCTLLVRPVFAETPHDGEPLPRATSEALATAILESLAADVQILNLSMALVHPSGQGDRQLEATLDRAAQQGVIIIAAAGNQATLGSSAITRHPWVIPVGACDLQGRPTRYSNLGHAIGRRGLIAPGQDIPSLATGGASHFSGTSAAAPFVTGTIALLWSVFPTASATAVRFAITQAYHPRRKTVVPPLLNAWAAYQFLATAAG
jgi:subtilisin family serine protease